jgi:hypothetical protein
MYVSFRRLTMLILWACLLPSLRSVRGASTPTGQINGSIVFTSVTSVARAYVTALIQPTTAATQPFSTTATVAPSGKFTLLAIPDGTYNICVQVPGTNYLNPCQWSAIPPSATVINGSPVTVPAITLAVGYRYQIRFNDPTGAIAQSQAAKSGAQLLLYAWANGGSVPLLWASNDATGWLYQAVIPFGTAIRVTLQGLKYQVMDQSGASVDLTAGVSIPVNVSKPQTVVAIPTSTTSPDLTYQIVNVSP